MIRHLDNKVQSLRIDMKENLPRILIIVVKVQHRKSRGRNEERNHAAPWVLRVRWMMLVKWIKNDTRRMKYTIITS